MKKILLSALALLTMHGSGFSQNLPSYVPANGLVGWWPFNGNANDESGNGINGVVNGASLTTDRFGNLNSAYNFSGTTNEITLTNSQNIVNGSFSVSAWCTIDELSPSNFDATIIGQFNGQIANDRKWLFGYRSAGNQRGLSYYLCDNSGNALANSFSINWAPQTSSWCHIIWVFSSGNSVETFTNGILHSSESLSLTNFNNTANNVLVKIGNSTDIDVPFGLPWNGKIDDIAIYNRALTQQEITALYQSGNTTANCLDLPSNLQQGLVGYWPFCGNANDESGNGNNGIVNGAKLTADRFGNAGSAYGFDGLASLITVPHNSSISMGGTLTQLTVQAWAKKNGSLNRSHVLGKRSGCSDSEFEYQIGYCIGSPDCATSLGIGFGGWQSSYAFTGLQLDTSNWFHIVGTFDGMKWSIFINGILTSNTSSPSFLSNSSELLIGGSGTCEKWQGKIDDIAIWNRALSQEEISQLYNQGICKTSITVTDTLLIHTGITSYNPVAYQNTLKVWPNPGNQDITLDAGNLASMQGWKYKVANTLGQTVVNETLINQQQTLIDLSTWGGNGIYYLHLINPQGHAVEIKKIVLAP